MTPLIIDSFAGGGGASTGIEMALGRSPDIAINHSADALAMHEVNHPDTQHYDSNIWDVAPREVTKGRPVGLFWASPDCKHFSKAKGGKPLDRNIRDLAWVVVRWAEEVKPDIIILENVEEFRTWGPLYEDGKPIVELRGHTFETWMGRLKKAGYKVQWRELRAWHYGAPTIRKRLFVIARRDGKPIVWPARTHGDPENVADAKLIAAGKLRPWRTAAEIIDWSLPCPSIFESSAEIMLRYGVRAVRPLADATMRRIARGVVRYVLEAPKPFIVKFNRGATGHPIDDPLATVTANSFVKRPGGAAPLGVVVPSVVGLAHGDSGSRRVYDINEPVGTVHAGGGNHALLAPSLATLNHGGGADHAPKPLDEPFRTLTASRDAHALIAPSIVRTDMASAARRNGVHAPTDPLNTLTTAGSFAVVAPVITAAQQGGSVRSADAPIHTITASPKDQNAVIVPSIVGCGGRAAQSAPRAGDEPLGTLTAKADGCVVAATMVQTGYGEREGQAPRCLDIDTPIGTQVGGAAKHAVVAASLSRFTQNGIGSAMDEPVDTVMAGAPKFGVVSAFLAQHNTGVIGHEIERPISTVTAGGSYGVSQQAVVAAHLNNFYGSNRTASGGDIADPAPTITTSGAHGGGHAGPISGFLTKYYGVGDNNVPLSSPAGTDTTKDRCGLVTVEIDGETYAIADIGMRMLTPRERFRAQGFPDSYIIDRRPDGSPISATVQGSCCGNSVCPPLAAALVAANCSHLAADALLEAAE